MDDSDYVKWFEAIFKGLWSQVPTEEPVPEDVLDDSREWASLLLADENNPYTGGTHVEQSMFLGLKMSPDKLLTTTGSATVVDPVEILETLQHFIVKCSQPKGAKTNDLREARLAIEPDFLSIFSAEAKRIVDGVIQTARALPVNLSGDSAMLLSVLKMPIGAISEWFDQVSLFWFAGGLYLDFPKAYSGNAVAIFKSGLDWYPTALRTKLGVARFGATNR